MAQTAGKRKGAIRDDLRPREDVESVIMLIHSTKNGLRKRPRRATGSALQDRSALNTPIREALKCEYLPSV